MHDEPWRLLGGMLEHRFDRLESLLRLVLQKEAQIMSIADDIVAEVTGETDAVTALSAVVDRLVAAVEAAGTDGPKLQAALASIKANKAAIVAATLKGTPAEPTP